MLGVTEIVFWFLALTLLYIYFGYPILILLMSFARRRTHRRDESYQPKVSLVICAYNEQKHIKRKMENSLSLNYPGDKLEIIVVSDGSTDKTNEYIRHFEEEGIKLHVLESRLGKTEAQNQGVKISSGEIVFFSDATTIHPPDVVEKLVRNLADDTIGGVTGKVIYVNPDDTGLGKGLGLYSKYEKFVRSRESRFQFMAWAAGCIYAVKKTAFSRIPSDLVSDFAGPLMIVEQGHRILYEPEAIAFVERMPSLKAEFARRSRIASQGLYVLSRMKHLMNPFRHGFLSITLISRRLLRWLSPAFLGAVFVSNLALINSSNLYTVIFGLQIALYLCALLGFSSEKLGIKVRLLNIPMTFVLMNLAAAAGIVRLLKGDKAVIWETIREGDAPRRTKR